MTTTPNDRRIALVADAGAYVGPALARELARRGHDLVLGNPSADLVDELVGMGASVEAVDGVRNLAEPDVGPPAGGGRPGAVRPHRCRGRLHGPDHRRPVHELDARRPAAARAGLPGGAVPLPARRSSRPWSTQGVGQIAADHQRRRAPGRRPARRSTPRPGPAATMLARNVADEVAAHRRAGERRRHQLHGLPRVPTTPCGATDPAVRAKVEAQVPMRRLGTMEEFAVVLPCRSSTARAGSPPASSSPTPEAGSDAPTVALTRPDREHDRHDRSDPRLAAAPHGRPCTRSTTRPSTRWSLEHVNHFEREGVLPIAFSLFHYTNMQDARSWS